MNERNLYAISIKHTIGDMPYGKRWKFGMRFTLWGSRKTKDDEERSFSGYTLFPNQAELYSLEDWAKSGYGSYIKKDTPVEISADICKRYRQYDTVLVTRENLETYCRIAGLSLDGTEDKW